MPRRVIRAIENLQRPSLLAGAVLLLGLATTWFVVDRIEGQRAEVDARRLDRWVERTQAALLEDLRRPGYGLGGARGASAVAPEGALSTAAVRRYVGARDLPREFPGVLGFGVIERVPREALPAWTARTARDAGPGFAVRTAGAARDLYVIRAIEPSATNRAALGFDIGSEAMRRRAVERVFREGKATLTGPIRLLQAPEHPGALLLAPVFASGASGADGSPVVAAVYAPIVYARMLAGLQSDGVPQIRVDLRDSDAGPGSDALLYSSTNAAGVGPARDVAFEFAGRRFLARYQGLPALYGARDGIPAWALWSVGVLLSVLAALALWLLATSRARAVALAHGMSAELDRLAMVARLTKNAVVVTDAEGRIQWANPAFERLSAYPLERLVGRSPGRLLQYSGSDPATVDAMRDAQLRRVPFHGEIRNRAADGREYWVDVEIQPIFAEDGQLEGFVGVHVDITEARRQQAALRESEAFLDRTNRVAGVGGWDLDLGSGQVRWSPETRRLHDVPDDYEPDVATAIQFYDEAARPQISAAINRAMATGEGWDLELPLVSLVGRRFWARAVGDVVPGADGKPSRLVGAFQDITVRKEAEIALASSTRLLDTTLRSIGDAVITTDLAGRVVWLNPAAERMTGWTAADARGRPANAVLRLESEGRDDIPPCPIDTCLAERAVVGLAPDTVLVSRDGVSRFAIEDSSSPIIDEDGVMHGVVMVFNDVTEKRRMAREMSFRARHDTLTGLANRGELEVRLREALERSHGGEPGGALLFLDLDHFKVINDSCGHHAGDQVLQEVGAVLKASVRQADLVARFGGDEFAVVLERCPLPRARAIAQQICEAIDAHRYVSDDGRRFRVGASVGVVPLDDRWSTVPALMQGADVACYAAKAEGRGRVVVQDTHDTAHRGHAVPAWGARIESALDNDAFELFAQRLVPIDGSRSGLNCEVLLRMRDDDGTLVSPGVFMASAERYQLASRIDRWVLRRLLQVLGTVDLSGVERIAMNLSGQSVGDSQFHRFAHNTIVESGVAPDKFALEITETSAITNLAQARRFVDDMRALGVQVALDDFGAGASSFGYLRQLRVDVLKIDGQFVRGLLNSPLDESAVRCFVDIAGVLGLETVAEHVENAEVAARLAAMGVRHAQGYHFHKPESLDVVLATASRTRDVAA